MCANPVVTEVFYVLVIWHVPLTNDPCGESLSAEYRQTKG